MPDPARDRTGVAGARGIISPGRRLRHQIAPHQQAGVGDLYVARGERTYNPVR